MGGGEDEKKKGISSSGHQHHPPPSAPEYGTFQGVANYPPPPPPVGFPQPVPPPGAADPPPQYYAHGYQTVPGYAVAEGRPIRERRLPCCGIGCGWFLFIIGFFLAAIPWYVGMIMLVCSRVDHREKPGFIACTVAGILAIMAVVLGVTKGNDDW